MPVRTTISQDGKKVTIVIGKTFCAESYTGFKAAFQSITDAVEFEVDLSGVTSIDSSGLGLLIHLREHAAATGSKVTIVKPSEIAQRNLEIAYFHELFNIVH